MARNDSRGLGGAVPEYRDATRLRRGIGRANATDSKGQLAFGCMRGLSCPCAAPKHPAPPEQDRRRDPCKTSMSSKLYEVGLRGRPVPRIRPGDLADPYGKSPWQRVVVRCGRRSSTSCAKRASCETAPARHARRTATSARARLSRNPAAPHAAMTGITPSLGAEQREGRGGEDRDRRDGIRRRRRESARPEHVPREEHARDSRSRRPRPR